MTDQFDDDAGQTTRRGDLARRRGRRQGDGMPSAPPPPPAPGGAVAREEAPGPGTPAEGATVSRREVKAAREGPEATEGAQAAAEIFAAPRWSGLGRDRDADRLLPQWQRTDGPAADLEPVHPPA